MKTLLVYHYHFRPGGVRSVIERALVEWCTEEIWDRVVLVTGEEPPLEWQASLAVRMGGTSLKIWEDPRLGYLSERTPSRENWQEIVTELLRKFQPNLIWAHNLSLGRNVWAGLELGRASREMDVPLLCHDHDWWPQHRWERWREMVAWGMDSLELAAEATFPVGSQVRHAVVHPQDVQTLAGAGHWVANPVPKPEEMSVSAEEREHANRVLGSEPFWLVPARILRRKNLLEAALLMKLLRPGLTNLLVAGPASPSEESYAAAAVRGAAALGLQMRLGVSAALGLSVPALMQPAEMILQTSVQEGFGLTALEASEQGKPLILRRLPMVTAWLEQSGGNFPHCYSQLILPKSAVPPNEAAAWKHQWHQNRCPMLPEPWRAQAECVSPPNFSHFSALSVAGQLHVLENFHQLEPGIREANPWLTNWQNTLTQPAAPPRISISWAHAVDALWKSAPTSEGSSLTHLETLFQAHLPDAGSWPMLW